MPIVQLSPLVRESLRVLGLTRSYAEIYRTVAPVRIVVDYFATQVSQIGIKTYRKVSPVERNELSDHGLQKLLDRPNPDTTTSRLFGDLTRDMKIYSNAYWWKRESGDSRYILRLPPEYVEPLGGGLLSAEKYRVSVGGNTRTLGREEVVHFRSYNPLDPRIGSSTIEALRAIIAEEIAAAAYREGLWKNAARVEGVIERPVEAEWSDEDRERFIEFWRASMSGAEGSGKTGILDEGMRWRNVSFSPREAEFIAGRKLTLETCARAWNVPLPLLSIGEGQSMASMKEHHKMLYQDTLPPDLRMIEDEIMLQLLPWFDDTDGVYVEFNVREKLQGSFEEQADVIRQSVGVPIESVNAARARFNYPPVGDPDDPKNPFNWPVRPLNVLWGPPGSPGETETPGEIPEESEPAQATAPASASSVKLATVRVREKARATIDTDSEARFVAEFATVLTRFFERQRQGVKTRGGRLDLTRWNRELAEELFPLHLAASAFFGLAAAKDLGTAYDPDRTVNYWRAVSEGVAGQLNQQTLANLDGKRTVDEVFDSIISGRAPKIATTRVTAAANWALLEAARQAGAVEE